MKHKELYEKMVGLIKEAVKLSGKSKPLDPEWEKVIKGEG